MKKIVFHLTLLILAQYINAQGKARFSVEPLMGLNADFSVIRYEETVTPYGGHFDRKDGIGTYSGVNLLYRTGKKGYIGIGYTRTLNQRKINCHITLQNGIEYDITDFRIKHRNSYYELFYARELSGIKRKLRVEGGIFYSREKNQEFLYGILGVMSRETDYKNSSTEEGGFVAGLQYSWKLNENLAIGLKSRIYYMASADELSNFIITPVLSYTFR